LLKMDWKAHRVNSESHKGKPILATFASMVG
jgi:hypothetical protein